MAGQRIEHAAGRTDDLAGGNHTGTAHLACRNGVPDGDGDVAYRADVAHGRVACVEHQPTIYDAIDRRRLYRTAVDFLQAAKAAVDKMHVAVDEAGEQGLSGKVDDALVSVSLSVVRHRAGLCDPALAHPDKAPVERFVSNPVYETRIEEDDCGFTGD